jgi:hypothetical protein
MCSISRKEAYRLYYLVKGHINISDSQAYAAANSYFRRLWIDGSDGAPLYLYENEFKELWEEKLKKEQKGIDKSI